MGLHTSTFDCKDQCSTVEPQVLSRPRNFIKIYITFLLFITNKLIYLLSHHPQKYFHFLTHTPGYQFKYIHPTTRNKNIYTYYNPLKNKINLVPNTISIKMDVMKSCPRHTHVPQYQHFHLQRYSLFKI